MLGRLRPLPAGERLRAAYAEAALICDEDVAVNEAIGNHGLGLIQALWQGKNGREPVRILTHCNAGWLATVDWGTALAPVYKAARGRHRRCTSGWTRPARATRARASPPGNWPRPASPIT